MFVLEISDKNKVLEPVPLLDTFLSSQSSDFFNKSGIALKMNYNMKNNDKDVHQDTGLD